MLIMKMIVLIMFNPNNFSLLMIYIPPSCANIDFYICSADVRNVLI